MRITINDFCLVVLTGETAWARQFANMHFSSHETIGLVDNKNDAVAFAQIATNLQDRRLGVVDASHRGPATRERLLKLAKAHHARTYALINAPEKSASMRSLRKSHFYGVVAIPPTAKVEDITLIVEPLPVDHRDSHGPFDIIGDVHGCSGELCELLDKLGYKVRFKGKGTSRRVSVRPPEGRTAIFVGDLVDRGPNSPDVLRIAMRMAADGTARTVIGNHDIKFLRWLKGRNVRLTHGLETTVAQMQTQSMPFRREVLEFLDNLPIHLWLADGKLAVAHAGIKPEMLGRTSGTIAEFCLYGDHSGEKDQRGLPIRYNWALRHDRQTQIIYGHTPVLEAEWLNNTLCLDTGCCFGGRLSALRWPEGDIVSVPARAEYVKTARPFGHPPARPITTPEQQIS